eukprot:1837058-Rhodomonas_salina.3
MCFVGGKGPSPPKRPSKCRQVQLSSPSLADSEDSATSSWGRIGTVPYPGGTRNLPLVRRSTGYRYQILSSEFLVHYHEYTSTLLLLLDLGTRVPGYPPASTGYPGTVTRVIPSRLGPAVFRIHRDSR